MYATTKVLSITVSYFRCVNLELLCMTNLAYLIFHLFV